MKPKIQTTGKKNKEIDILKTIFASFWIWGILGFLFGGAILYSLSFIQSESGIKAICFWGIISLILVREFCNALTNMTFNRYKRIGGTKHHLKK